MAEYFNVGKIVASHGVNGELLFLHGLGKKTSLKGLTTLFIEEKKNSFLPWFIKSTRIKSATEIYLKLDGMENRESAMKLVQKKVWISEEDHKKFASRSSPATLIGYVIINDAKELGDIKEVIEQPQQLLCRLEIDKKEVLIPLHENSLKKIDHRKKQVIVELPEGLLDIYLA